jgi:hypothetical protein
MDSQTLVINETREVHFVSSDGGPKFALVPLPITLKKYGLDEAGWLSIFARQNGVCAVCRALPKTGRLCIDHDHAPGWKKMLPEDRVKFVRGLLCFWCNVSFVGRGITVEKARNVVTYLEQFSTVRPEPVTKNKKPTRVK